MLRDSIKHTLSLILFFLIEFSIVKSGYPVLKIPGSIPGLATTGTLEYFTSDPTALVTTPLAVFSKENHLSIGHQQWFQDSFYNTLAISTAFKGISTGLSLRYFAVDGIEIRERPTPEPLGTTGAYFYNLTAALGISPFNRLNLAFSLKYLYEKYYLDTATGLAFDLAGKFNIHEGNFILTAGLSNMGKMTKLSQKSSSLPFNLYSGLQISGELPDLTSSWRMGMAVVSYPASFSQALRLGAEFKWHEWLSLQTGLSYRSGEWGYAGGLGLKYGRFAFQYAFSGYQTDLGLPQGFSLQYIW